MPPTSASELHGIDRPALERVLVPVVRAHGAELVDIEFKPERGGWVLRVCVERAGAYEKLLSTRDAAVNLELCAGISRDLSPALDVADLIPHPYHLEVSSPGVERPLRDERDYLRFRGEKAKLKLSSGLSVGASATAGSGAAPPAAGTGGDGQRVLIGVLAGVVDGKVRVVEGERTHEVPLSVVERARLVFEFGASAGSRTHKRKH
jgi:ribosome maturation factor RimP